MGVIEGESDWVFSRGVSCALLSASHPAAKVALILGFGVSRLGLRFRV